MLRDVVATGCPAAYVAGDTAYTGAQVRKTADRLGLARVGAIAPRTTVVYRGRRQQVQHLALPSSSSGAPSWACAPLRCWSTRRCAAGLRAVAGAGRLVVLKNEHGNYEYVVTNALTCDLALLRRRKRSRWRIETIFRDMKQLAGLAACQCWVEQALVSGMSRSPCSPSSCCRCYAAPRRKPWGRPRPAAKTTSCATARPRPRHCAPRHPSSVSFNCASPVI
jgi:hypothetical protein